MEKFRISKERAFELLAKYGSPLYVYSEELIRKRCREMKGLLSRENFRVNYSAKANTNLEILKIIRDEGLYIDAMSPGELIIEEKQVSSLKRSYMYLITFLQKKCSLSLRRDSAQC